MPITVPNAQQVELQTLSLPGASPMGDGGLSAVAQGANVASDQLRAAETERQQRRDVERVRAAQTALGDLERTMNTDMRTNRTGSRADQVTNDVDSWWESEPAKISASLENETQRTLFAEAAARRREISLNSFSEFEARESHNAVNDSLNAHDVNSINDGAANYDNPEAIAQARQDIIDNSVARARFNNLPIDGEVTAAARLDALTKLHTNVIENIAEDNPEAASAYFEANKTEIAGSVHDALRTKLKGSKDVVAAQRTADAAWAQGLPETQALDWVRKNSEGQEREHALSLVRAQFADQEAAKTQYERAEAENARSAFNDGGLAALTPRMVSVLERTSPGELRWMRSQTPQDQVTTNWDVYQGLVDLARQSPNEFRDDTNLAMFRGDLNQAELTRLGTIQEDLRKGVPSSPLTLNQIVTNYTAALDKAQAGQLENDVTVLVEDLQKRLNRKLTNEEMQGVVEQRMMEVSVPDAGWFWFDAKKPLYELTDDETVAVAYDAIPSDVREEAEADLKASGREPSPANVVALYKLFLEQGNQ